MRTAAVLLAAGDSTRMGVPKGLLAWRGRPLLGHQADTLLRSRVDACIVVLGRDHDRLAPLVEAAGHADRRARIARNPRPEEGRSSSVRIGLQALEVPPDALLFVAVDQPLEGGVVDALIDTAERLGIGIAAATGDRAAPPPSILVPVFSGRRGHPVLFSGALLPELRAIDENGQGLRGVLRARPGRVHEMPWNSAGILVDLNTPEDAGRAGAAVPAPE